MLTACGSAPTRQSEAPRKGGYYLDDGPHEKPPADLDRAADAQPRAEPIKASTTRPYTAMGRTYTPMGALAPYSATGVASWYGKRYHGQPTASGEIYDMYAMTAAHPTLPLPSYAKVTNVATGKTVLVRVNDRGPFLHGRVIDLSYAAAHRIGIAQRGSGEVEVEAIIPSDTVLVTAAPLPPVSAIRGEYRIHRSAKPPSFSVPIARAYPAVSPPYWLEDVSPGLYPSSPILMI
jgi:rare lipoprotein A